MAAKPIISLWLARADNGVIGHDGALPWRIPADLKRFKQETMGKPMVMGRKTFDSLPGLLPGRRHIVLTRNDDWQADGAERVSSVQHALDHLAGEAEICIIGGAEIYHLFLPMADRIEVSRVHMDAIGDTVMDDFDQVLWRESASEHHAAQDHPTIGPIPSFTFATLVRNLPMQ
ncbi:dihydrofolate reductase [Parasphingorhabdus sp. DH2-15]|uniref:dihydrofolate reductase n=1 Tax=Parasphingorhabdus sp. DH2-15 TaxID=3444112 RepID=UPI003F6856DB